MTQLWKLGLALLVSGWLASCVTYTVNSDGSLQSTSIDKTKLSSTYVDLAIEYLQHNTPQVALERVNLAIATDSDDARAYMVRAMIYQQLGKPEMASDDFKQALNKKNDYADAYVNYAVFLCDQKQYSAAAQNFAFALNNPLYMTPEVGYYDRGQCYYQQKSYEFANNDFLKAMSYRNVPQSVYTSMAQLQYDTKNYSVANYYINKFEGSQTPGSMWLHIRILQALLDSGSDPSKIREYTGYHNTLGQVLINNYGDSPEAQKYLVRYSNGGSNTLPKISSVTPTVSSIAAINDDNQSPPDASLNKHSPITASGSIKSAHRRYVIVKPSETLYRIGENNAISPQKLEQINGLNGKTIKSGMKLYLE